MRLFSKLALTVTVAALLAGPAMAQRGFRGMGGMMASPGFLLNNKGVQKELSMTADQIEKVPNIMELFAKYAGDFQGLQDLSGEERTAKIKELASSVKKDGEKLVADLLKPEQAKRLKEIGYQVMGSAAFVDEEIQKTLKITDEQKSKIKTLTEDAEKELGELRQNLRGASPEERAEAMKKMQAMQKETTNKVSSLLTADQKKTWSGMVGKAFDYKPEFPGRRGGGA